MQPLARICIPKPCTSVAAFFRAVSYAILLALTGPHSSGQTNEPPAPVTNTEAEEQARLQKGKALADTADYKGALAEYGKAIELNPKDTAAYVSSGLARLLGDDPKGAIGDFTHAIALDPNNDEGYEGRGASRIDVGDLNGGIRDYTEAIRLVPAKGASYSGRAKAELAQNKFKEALADYNQAIAKEGNDPLSGGYVDRGEAKIQMGDYDGAIADFTQALAIPIQMFPELALQGRGLAKSKKGDFDGALDDFNAAIKPGAGYPPVKALVDRGYVRYAKGDFDDAIADENQAIDNLGKAELLPQVHFVEDLEWKLYYSAAYNRRGMARHAKGDLSGASADFNDALRICPNYPDALRNRGIVEDQQRKFDAAIADFNMAMVLSPKDPEFYFYRAVAKYHKGEFSQAFADYKTSAEFGSPGGQRVLGLLYESGKGVAANNGEAVKWFQRAAYQNDAAAQYFLALMYFSGAGVPQNEVEALAWTNIAASSGRADSVKLRAYLEFRLGEQASLAAQQRSQEILQNVHREAGAPRPDSPQGDNRLVASGTGVFVTNDGLILTAAHVIKGANSIKVKTKAGLEAATVVSVDTANDVALIRCTGTFQAVPMKDSSEVKLGQPVFTIGFPEIQLQGVNPKMTRGEISSLTGIHDDVRDWQISVPIQPGNSGGPLFDENGNVVGLAVATLDAVIMAKVLGTVPENVNYAVKSAYALPLLAPFQKDLVPESPDVQMKVQDVVARVQDSVVLVLIY